MATPSQDDLVITIHAKIDELNRSLDAAQRRLDEFERQNQNAGQGMADSIARARDQINKSMEAIAVSMGVATAAATLLTNSAANTAMEIQRFASISNMSAQEFQFYAAGANAVGIETEKLGDIFKDVQDKVGDFITTEGGELEDFFTNIAPKVGVTAEQFRKLGGADALLLYVDSLQKAGVSQAEMIFYLESIADDGSRLLPLLKDGGKGFELFGQAAAKAGALMSDEFLDKAAEMKTSMWLLEQSLKGARNQMSEEMLPVLRDLAAQFTDVSDGQSAASKTGVIFSNILRGLTATAVGAVAAFDIFGSALGAIGAAGAKMWEGFDITNNPIVNLKIQIANAKQAKKVLEDAFTDAGIAKKIESYSDTINGVLQAGNNATSQQLKDLAAVLDEANKIDGSGKTGALGKKAAEEAKKKADAAAKELADAKKSAADLLETYKQAAMDEEELRSYTIQRQKADLDSKRKAGLISEEQYRQAKIDLDEAFDKESLARTQAALAEILSETMTANDKIERDYKERNKKIAELNNLGRIPSASPAEKPADTISLDQPKKDVGIEKATNLSNLGKTKKNHNIDKTPDLNGFVEPIRDVGVNNAPIPKNINQSSKDIGADKTPDFNNINQLQTGTVTDKPTKPSNFGKTQKDTRIDKAADLNSFDQIPRDISAEKPNNLGQTPDDISTEKLLEQSKKIRDQQLAEQWQIQADADAAEVEQRLAKYEALAEMARSAGMTEIEIMTAEHDAKMAMLSELNQQELDMLGLHQENILAMEQDFAARRLDQMLGSGQAMQNLTDAFQKSQLQGALQFFASDFGGFSQHSRKMFELMKAAKIAQALISVPSTTMAAYEAGTKVGGPALGAVYAAAALATQISNLRQLQSATYGGKSSGGGGGSASVGTATTSSQSQPTAERFVNINLMGNDDTMFSKAAVRSLIERINEETKDGAVLRVT